MKLSLNWVREFTKADLPTEELIEKIGAQLGAVEKAQDYSDKYKGATIVKVVSCTAHPNADKLHVCLIDDVGVTKNVERTKGLVQVVCGAPNVAEGQNVVWLPPGAIVPATYDYSEQMVLDTRSLGA